MQTQWFKWLIATAALAAALVADSRPSEPGTSKVFRAALVFGLGLVAGGAWLPRAEVLRKPQQAKAEMEPRPALLSVHSYVRTELATAIEHLECVGAMIEVSETHRQALPRAVPNNLRLVVKHLEKARTALQTADADPRVAALLPDVRLSGMKRGVPFGASLPYYVQPEPPSSRREGGR